MSVTAPVLRTTVTKEATPDNQAVATNRSDKYTTNIIWTPKAPKLTVINGKLGHGKTYTAEGLQKRLPNSVLVGFDGFMDELIEENPSLMKRLTDIPVDMNLSPEYETIGKQYLDKVTKEAPDKWTASELTIQAYWRQRSNETLKKYRKMDAPPTHLIFEGLGSFMYPCANDDPETEHVYVRLMKNSQNGNHIGGMKVNADPELLKNIDAVNKVARYRRRKHGSLIVCENPGLGEHSHKYDKVLDSAAHFIHTMPAKDKGQIILSP